MTSFFDITELQCTSICDERELVIDYEIKGKFKVLGNTSLNDDIDMG